MLWLCFSQRILMHHGITNLEQRPGTWRSVIWTGGMADGTQDTEQEGEGGQMLGKIGQEEQSQDVKALMGMLATYISFSLSLKVTENS